MSFLSYLFWPNPPLLSYGDLRVILLLGACVLITVVPLLLTVFLGRGGGSFLRKATQSWGKAGWSFGLTGLLFTLSRVEGIQYLSMRFLWVLWSAALGIFVFFQVRAWRLWHYEVLPQLPLENPLSKYLPKRKRK